MNGKPEAEKQRLKDDALQMLDSWEGVYRTQAVFGIFDANSDGDDLLIGGVRIPLLRQQKPSAAGMSNLCLADFVRPLSKGVADKAGAFATSTDGKIELAYKNDPYLRMLSQTLADRLAEGTAERMHHEVRTRYWGYAPDETLTMAQILREDYQGIRPAVGYPSLPDTSVNFILSELVGMKEIGIRLTESGMMHPHASVSGLMFAHPKAHYFDLGKIGEDQFLDYARRRKVPAEVLRKFLQASLMRR